MNSGKLKPLGIIMNLIQNAGYEVTYAFDDLLFIGDSDFLIQFSETDAGILKLFFHHELDKNQHAVIKEKFQSALKSKEMIIEYSGTFILKERPESEEIDVVFYP